MSAFSSKGIRILMSKGDAVPVVLVPTAITAAKPAEVTVADTTGITDNDLIVISGTDIKELDGKTFAVDNMSATTFELLGSDTSGASTGTLGSAPKATVYPRADVLSLCLSDFSMSTNEPGTVSVATFCNPSASLPSATTEAGTVSVGGYVDETAADYLEMMKACEDGKTRVIAVEFPGSHGMLVSSVTFSDMAYEIPIEGAPSWSATGVLGSKFAHIF